MFKFITDWYNKHHEAKQAIIARRFKLQIMQPQVTEDESNFYCAVRALMVADSSIMDDDVTRLKLVAKVLEERDYLIDSCYYCYGERAIPETNYHIEKVYLDLCGSDRHFAEVADEMYPFFEKIEENDEA